MRWKLRILRHARDEERAARLLDKAEKNCLISNSIKTIVKLEPEILFLHSQSELS
jgi:organic hydroperoxide reductase OsmC/OhrA